MAARCRLAGVLDMLRVTLSESGTDLALEALKDGSCLSSPGAVSRRIWEACISVALRADANLTR